eukprot:CAMPEP_0176490102 /NCGR_PEP_ID=MMETSP0200_2-20121128/7683_1 /TAXON_ID=947934 /ORGANISM="Chaetoceros sp., Strain GSL56" /LENGTH=421 /DNA_ID=CAMNT_0017887369 /DNA_START=60 /DNA_END=1325 /DNA_ORIENTATION=-
MNESLDKIKMEVEAARFEVVQAEKEISTVRLALRNLASATAAATASTPQDSQETQTQQQQAGNEEEEENANSLLLSVTKITGLPEGAEPILRIQLSSPIEEQVITKLSDPLDDDDSSSQGYYAKFRGVDTSVATLLVKAWDKDIPLGSSALYDVKPLCEVDVLGGILKKVTHLEVAIVPDSMEEHDIGGGDDVVVDDEDVVDDVEEQEEFQDAKSQAPSEQGKDDGDVDAEEKGKDDEEKEENTEQATTPESATEEQAETSPDDEKKTNTVDNDSNKKVPLLLPTCTVHFRVEYNSSIQEQKDELYKLLDKASKKKAVAVDQLRKSASALNRASNSPGDGAAGVVAKKQEKAIKPGFLKKSAGSDAAVKKEFFLKRWYRNTLGPDSLLRNVFPIVKNYILFFGGVALMHFQGQQLALPPPV